MPNVCLYILSAIVFLCAPFALVPHRPCNNYSAMMCSQLVGGSQYSHGSRISFILGLLNNLLAKWIIFMVGLVFQQHLLFVFTMLGTERWAGAGRTPGGDSRIISCIHIEGSCTRHLSRLQFYMRIHPFDNLSQSLTAGRLQSVSHSHRTI